MAGNQRGSGGRRPRVERCVFCGKSAHDVERLIAGPPGIYICNECIELCYSIITEDEARQRKTALEIRNSRGNVERIGRSRFVFKIQQGTCLVAVSDRHQPRQQ